MNLVLLLLIMLRFSIAQQSSTPPNDNSPEDGSARSRKTPSRPQERQRSSLGLAIKRYLNDVEEATIESLFPMGSNRVLAADGGGAPQVQEFSTENEIRTPGGLPKQAAEFEGVRRRVKRHIAADGDPMIGDSGALSAWSTHHSHHHRRRRKGCPPLHGKRQYLCPSQAGRRYDVCISRSEFCNHVQDCPNGEDEDPKLCLFYKPLDDQLKTLSHAVLLLVDGVLQEQIRAEL